LQFFSGSVVYPQAQAPMAISLFLSKESEIV